MPPQVCMERSSTEQVDGDRQVFLHPLVIMNLTDHHVRTGGGTDNNVVVGVLLGQQQGLDVTIYDSFEMVVHMGSANLHDTTTSSSSSSSSVTIDRNYFAQRQGLYQQVYPNYEVVGWYAISSHVTLQHLEINRAMMADFHENPLFLTLDPASSREADQKKSTSALPITAYESQVQVLENHKTPTRLFVKIKTLKVKTLESERIAMDHVVNMSPTSESGTDSLCFHLDHVRKAITMLTQRTHVLMSFLRATKNAAIPTDHRILRQISSICSQLPVMTSSDVRYHDAFLQDYNDSMLVTYLASLTNSTASVNDIIDKFSIVNDRESRSKRRGNTMHLKI